MKFDNGGDDGKFFIEGIAQFDITVMRKGKVVSALWEDDEGLTEDEIDILNRHFTQYISDQWYWIYSKLSNSYQ